MDVERQRLNNYSVQLPLLIQGILLRARHRLDLLEQRAESADPTKLLQRGYSMTLHNGRIVRNAKELRPGDTIETRLAEGTITSEVTA
jgi:exodeoxyribonuclease VII large subunit